MHYLDRVVADSSDREAWLNARASRIGASDAARFARPDSVETYVRQKLTPSNDRGNGYTDNGHRWEPQLLAFIGVPGNSLFFHHPDEFGFGATPDGVLERPDGSLVLAEIKTKHERIVAGPTPAEFRQLVWQLFVLPEATELRWCWGELIKVPTDEGFRWELRRDSPKALTFYRDDPKIVAAQAQIVPIATRVLAAVRAVRGEEENR